VKNATRGSNIIDKIFTNISKFYDVPEVVPPLGFSDHNSVLLNPLNHRRNSRSFQMVRDALPSSRRSITEALSSVNWSPMYHLGSCDEQFQYFSSLVDGIVDRYLPLKRIKSDSSDKLWITPKIKRLISKRQVTWRRENKPMFRFYRNINNLCRRARSKYYTNNVANTTQSNPRKWWSAVKNIAGLAPSKNVSTLVYNGQPIPIRLWPTCLMTSLLPLGIPCLRLLGRLSKSVIFLPIFTFQSTTPRKHYNPSSPVQLQVLTKSCLGSSVKIPRYYVAH
jgi:hypothetical protein